MLSRTLLSRAAALASRQGPRTTALRPKRTLSRPRLPQTPIQARAASHVHDFTRAMSSSNKSAADDAIDEITELYATARDEFEIAAEETEANTVYAEDDRKAAREELTKLQEAYKAVVEGEDKELGEEVKRRVGQRIRELEQGVAAMEEAAMNHD